MKYKGPEPLSVTILHEIPGRMRVQLSLPLEDPPNFDRLLRSHEGIDPIQYTPATRTVLLNYDPMLIRREELTMRVALTFSLENNEEPVRIVSRPPGQPLTTSVAASGSLLLAALSARLLGARGVTGQRLERFAGLATATAVLGHGWQEVRSRGNFDPEVLSVVYLITSMLRGNALSAALFTWFTAFGRHVIQGADFPVEVRPVEGKGEGEYEVMAAPAEADTGWGRAARAVLALGHYFGSAGQGGGPRFMSELQNVVNVHGKVLEGLGPWDRGIPVRFGRGRK
ncbi:MAG: hypothetical protein JSW50_11690 [Candidatus Latescibacterota bacterium]|nr:MAG: hypothetical protein JSW50_11690 [Candidatus Latescibacterota bacterium]